ncbi:MAG: hypothetical protein MJ025_00090 [Victivallaceae bacterium]|nr:hypothetical protein [Victivallaceae bacterium]
MFQQDFNNRTFVQIQEPGKFTVTNAWPRTVNTSAVLTLLSLIGAIHAACTKNGLLALFVILFVILLMVALTMSKYKRAKCENCGFEGTPSSDGRNDGGILITLFLLGVIPALVYICSYHIASGYSCPRCGNRETRH